MNRIGRDESNSITLPLYHGQGNRCETRVRNERREKKEMRGEQNPNPDSAVYDG